jgi:hypothetical protein
MRHIEKATAKMLHFRDKMSVRLQKYLCSDDNINITVPEKTTTIQFTPNAESTVETMLNLPHAKIWKISSLISQPQCEVLGNRGGAMAAGSTISLSGGLSVDSSARSFSEVLGDSDLYEHIR